jgi:hypothetical protein
MASEAATAMGAGPEGLHALMFPVPDQQRLEAATTLNGEITSEEVQAALDKIGNGKAAGVDGIPIEFLKYAEVSVERHHTQNVLLQHLTFLFNHVLRYGYPQAWSIGAVVPVPKPKGDIHNKDDYRGITVGQALSKLYSMVLLNRLDCWAEDNGMRARGQAGFRRDRGTPDNAFILNHVIERYRSRKEHEGKREVYTAFIDFRKAYDSVDRSLLWECLRSLGLHGRIMDNLIEMYTGVKLRVRVGGQLSEEFPSDIGVKQGDPLSPLLFGLFIDRLERVLNECMLTGGVKVGSTLLRLLLYADDLVLFAESAAELQDMLDQLHQFCVCNSMTVNIKKSEVVVFNRMTQPGQVRIRYNGADMKVVDMFVYLGMVYHEKTCMQKGWLRNLDKGRRAMYAMIRRCYEMDLHNVYIKCHLFDSLVRPVLNYGCEVWGPGSMCSGNSFVAGARQEFEDMHLGFLRQCLGVRKSVPLAVLMHELAREPVAMGWLRQTVRFWNKIQKRPEDDLLRIALMDSCVLASQDNRCWAARLQACLRRDYKADFVLPQGDGVESSLDEQGIMREVKGKWWDKLKAKLPPVDGQSAQTMSVVRSVPDECHDGFKLLTYFRWFAPTDSDMRKSFWYTLSRKEHISVVAKFRMGVHWLNIDAGRMHNCMPRSQRLCKCCDLRSREDELHVLSCPLYRELRAQYTETVFREQIGEAAVRDMDLLMKTCMNPPAKMYEYKDYWEDLAGFLIRSRFARDDCLTGK